MKIRGSFVANSSSASYCVTWNLSIEPGIWRHAWTRDFSIQPFEGFPSFREAEERAERWADELELLEAERAELRRVELSDTSPLDSSTRAARRARLAELERCVDQGHCRWPDPADHRYYGLVSWFRGCLGPIDWVSLRAGASCSFGALSELEESVWGDDLYDLSPRALERLELGDPTALTPAGCRRKPKRHASRQRPRCGEASLRKVAAALQAVYGIPAKSIRTYSSSVDREDAALWPLVCEQFDLDSWY